MKALLVVVAVLTLHGAPAHAQGPAPAAIPAPWTLTDVVERFLKGNLVVESARHRVDIARAEQVAATLRPNPTLTVTADDVKVAGSSSFNQLYEVSAVYSQPFERGERRRLRREVADLGVSLSEAQLAEVLRQRLAEVKRTFYEVLLARQALVYATETRRGLDELIRRNQARFEEGDLAEGELLRSRLERAKFQSTLAHAELTLDQSALKLFGLLNEPGADASRIVGELAVSPVALDVSALEAAAAQRAPAVVVAERGVAAAERRMALERARSGIDPAPFVGVKRTDRDSMLVFGVALPLPLFERNQAAIARAAAEEALAKSELAQARTRARYDVHAAYRTWQAASQRVAAFEGGLLRQAEESRDIVRSAYDEGAADLLGVLDAERTRAEIRQQYAQALFDYHTSLVQLEAVSGMELAR